MAPEDPDSTPFESSDSSGSGGLNAMLAPLAVALAGVVLGGLALYFSLGGSGQAEDAQASLESITAKAEGLETRVRDLEAKFSEQASQLSALDQQVRLITRDTQQALNQVGVEINRNRQDLGEASDKLTELIETLNRSGRPAASAPASAPPAPSLPVATASSSDGPAIANLPVASPATTHTIRQGDTFTKLAERYQVSVTAILAANPDVDPRRLRVGQKINIPSPQP